MNRRAFLAALAAPLVAPKPARCWVGLDLASGPSRTGYVHLLPWQLEMLRYMQANPGLRLSVFPARRNGKTVFKQAVAKFAGTVYE